MTLCNHRIVTYKDDNSVDKMFSPSKSSERGGATPDEVAVLSIPGIREQLDIIELGISELDELIGVKEEEIAVQVLKLQEIDGVFSESFVMEKTKTLVPDYSKIEALDVAVENGDITLNYKMDPETRKQTICTQETPGAFLARKDIVKLQEDYKFKIVHYDDCPKNSSEFFAAWELNGTKVDVNIGKAKSIRMVNIRKARDVKFAELDKEYMIAERDSNVSLIAQLDAKRVRLKNVPQDCEDLLANINDIESLKNLWHDDLEKSVLEASTSESDSMKLGITEQPTGLTSL